MQKITGISRSKNDRTWTMQIVETAKRYACECLGPIQSPGSGETRHWQRGGDPSPGLFAGIGTPPSPPAQRSGVFEQWFKPRIVQTTSSGFPFKGRIIVQKALFGVPCQGDQGLLAQATLALFNAPFGVPFQVEGLALEPKIVKATSFGVSFEVDQFPETGQEQIPCLLLFKLRGLGA